MLNNFKLKKVNNVDNLKENKSLKNIMKLLSFIFVFAFTFSISFSKAYAERYKYTFKTAAGEDYIIIADVDESKNVTIVSSPLIGINPSVSGSNVSGTSFYNVIANDYENAYNDQSNASSKLLNYRSEDLVKLIEIFTKDQYFEGTNLFTNLEYKGEHLATGSKGDVLWGKDGNKDYKTIILNATNRSKKNPFYANDEIRNSSSIVLNGKKISELFTDKFLIEAYELNASKTGFEFISKEVTDDYFAQTKGYKIYVDTESNEKYILMKISDSSSKVVASFVLAEKEDTSNSMREETYLNNKDVKFYSTPECYGITQATKQDLLKNVDNELLLYYSYNPLNDRKGTLQDFKGDVDVVVGNDSFVAIRNGTTNSVNFYELASNGTATIIGSVSILNFKDLLITDTLHTSTGEWELKQDGNIVKIYKTGEKDLKNNAYYLDISRAFLSFNDNDHSYDVAIPTKKGEDGIYVYDLKSSTEAYISYVKLDKVIQKKYENGVSPLSLFEKDLTDGNKKMFIQVYKIEGTLTNTGLMQEDKIKLSVLKSNKDYNDLPPELTFKEYLTTTSNKQSIMISLLDSAQRIGMADYYNDAIGDTEGMSFEFIATLVGYGKIILILLIFIAILIAGFRHIIDGTTNPEARAKTIQTGKQILIGVMIFVSLILIVLLIQNYLDKGMETFTKYSEQTYEAYFTDDYKVTSQSMIMNILEVFINVYNEIMEGIVQVFAKQVSGTTEGMDYIKLIYNVYDNDGNISSMKPFDENGVEWSRILSGYNVLVSISYLLLLIALVKTAIEYVIYAGDEKKITKIKETWFRMFWSILMILAVPYLVQLLIYLFNYMTAIVPVKYTDARFDINITFDGILGAIGRNIFINTRFELYFAFMVRHVMLDILVVSSPIVIASWAISEKFKSFPMWFGELITNIAMQFCYAVGFLVILLLSYEGENPVYGLLLITVAMGLSKFVKESLQGYFQSGAGINEESEGKSISNTMFGWKSKAKSSIKKAGRIFERASRKFDRKQNTKLGKFATIAGQTMQGKFSSIHISSNASDAERKMISELDKVKYTDEHADAKEYLAAQERGEEGYRGEGKVYDAIDAYIEAKNGNFVVGNAWTRGKEKIGDKLFNKQLHKSERAAANPGKDDVQNVISGQEEIALHERDNEYLQEKYSKKNQSEERTKAFNQLLNMSNDPEERSAREDGFGLSAQLTDMLLANEEGEAEARQELINEASIEGLIQQKAIRDEAVLDVAEELIKKMAYNDGGVFNEEKHLSVSNLTEKLANKNEQKLKGVKVNIDTEGLNELFDSQIKNIYKKTGVLPTRTNKKK